MGTVQIDGSTPKITVGNATAEDATILFDGNAQDFYIALDDSADDLIIGLGSAVGTTPAISINEDRDVTISDGAIDFDIASHDTSNGLKLGGTLVTATAAELNMVDGSAKSTSSITVADADGIIIIDGTTTKQIPASDLKTYAGFTATTITGTTALAVSPAKTDELIISDGGTLKRLDFTHIYPHPAFNVVADNALEVSTATWTKLVLDSEILDSNAAYDAATNYRFTVPANEGGNYFFHCSVDIQEGDDHDDVRLNIYKNGSAHMLTQVGRFHNYDTATLTTMLSLAATDYVEMFIYHAKGSDMTVGVGDASNRGTRWCGWKILGT
jgi:hypothetical protein